MERVLVCGSRDWTDKFVISYLLIFYDSVIHGGCRGADQLAGEAAAELGIPVQVFPAAWDKYGKAAGPIRNQQMLDEGKPTKVVAFHDDLENSKGTMDMIRRAHRAGISVGVCTHHLDGRYRQYES